MTPAELITAGQCTARCLIASTSPTRCCCPGCDGYLHGALARVSIDTLLDGRRRGLHKLSDLELLSA